MGKSGDIRVLRRMAQAAQQAHEVRAMSPARALRLAVERTAARDLGFALSVTGVERAELVADALAADLPDPALILLLDGPDGVPGAAVLDLQLAAALVEAQTLGRVHARPAAARALGRTDAALAQPLISGLLSRFGALMEDDGAYAARFAFGAMIADARALALALGTGPYQVMRLGCEIGADRPAELLLALPVRAPAEVPVSPAATTGEGKPPGSSPLRARMMTAPARLDAVLCRITLPLAQVRGLQVGQVLDLPDGALRRTRVEVAGGRRVAWATLGQVQGMRALRLYDLAEVAGTPAAAPLPGPVAAQPLAAPQPVAAPPPDRIDPAEGLADLPSADRDLLAGIAEMETDGAPGGLDG